MSEDLEKLHLVQRQSFVKPRRRVGPEAGREAEGLGFCLLSASSMS